MSEYRYSTKSLQEQLEMAIKIASVNHYGQKDKGGKPYIFHLLNIMNSVESIDSKVVAILHDILEDTSVTKEDLLNMGFDEEIVESIDVLTKKKKQDYMDYIKCVKNDSIAREIKLIDLKDNMNLTRLEIVTEKDLKRTEKYLKAYKYLDMYRVLEQLENVLYHAMEYTDNDDVYIFLGLIDTKIHYTLYHGEPFEIIDISEDIKQVRELIDTKGFEFNQLYEELLKVNKMLDYIK